jgi:uncharacterized membrane protein
MSTQQPNDFHQEPLMNTSTSIRIVARSTAAVATALALLAGSMLPAYAASAPQAAGQSVQAGVMDAAQTNRVPSGCYSSGRCR